MLVPRLASCCRNAFEMMTSALWRLMTLNGNEDDAADVADHGCTSRMSLVRCLSVCPVHLVDSLNVLANASPLPISNPVPCSELLPVPVRTFPGVFLLASLLSTSRTGQEDRLQEQHASVRTMTREVKQILERTA
eukprot:746338-Hanusia_phi.AAC.2